MRPPLLWPPLLLLLLLHVRVAAPADSPSQLPAPQNPKIRLYNTEQVLSWEPGSLSHEAGPVVYQVQFKYPSSREWSDVTVSSVGVNCSKISATECDFTPTGQSPGFLRYFNVSLRVRAELPGLPERASAWASVPWFQHYRNVTIGPPGHVWVTPGEGSLVIKLSPPFNIADPSMVTFLYYVHYGEKTGIPQVKGPFRDSSIVLRDLQPLREYCLRVRAHLLWKSQDLSRPGHFSNVSCHETSADASTKLQRVVLVAVATFLSLAGLAGACVFLILRFRGLIKHCFHSPPGIPAQIEEYLKDPAQHMLEALDQDSPAEDDAWESVSEVSSPEQEQRALSRAEGAPPTL
ncbi:interferon gamma receptor 2 [Myotis yumanensis]|uniref:interferon gamma receptor 2 n=1 Tax=Myotis yumanensis TaxID=159337 RepID=UPI0038CF410B